MSIRNPGSALLVALAVTAVWVAPRPASASAVGGVHLVVQMTPPRFGDQNDLIYQVSVANLGPDRATRLVARQSVLFCPGLSTPLRSCEPGTDLVFTMADIARGGQNSFAVLVFLPTSGAVVVRNTVEMVKAGERDVASTLGLCQDGARPQPACATRVTEVR